MILENLLNLQKLNIDEDFSLNKLIDEHLCNFYLQHGRYDLPNTEENVDLEDSEWQTLQGEDTLFEQDLYLQKSIKVPLMARIVKEKYGAHVRIARGHLEAMQEKLKRLQQRSFYVPGDLIYIDRDETKMDASTLETILEAFKDKQLKPDKISVPLSIYAHVGIYIGQEQIVHFAGKNDLVGKRTIHICSIKEFLHSVETHKTPKDIYIMHFPGDGRRPYKLYQDTSRLNFNPAHIDAFETFDFTNIKLFSAAETVKRAKAMVGEPGYSEYDFMDNNCEHLAFFCKTGKKFSVQAENLRKIIEDSEKMLNTPIEGCSNLLEKVKRFSAFIDALGKRK